MYSSVKRNRYLLQVSEWQKWIHLFANLCRGRLQLARNCMAYTGSKIVTSIMEYFETQFIRFDMATDPWNTSYAPD
jgi:hypothetical protein